MSAQWELKPADIAAPSGLWVGAYYAGWYWDWDGTAEEAVAAVDMTALTHFIFGFYTPGTGTKGGNAGEVIEGSGTAHTQVESSLIDKAHSFGKKAMMMLGGAGEGNAFMTCCGSEYRSTFVTNILDKCVAKDYDGVDIDWEDSIESNSAQQAMAVTLITELRTAAALRSRYQSPNDPFLITFPGPYLNINTENPAASWRKSIADVVDQYNLMTYSMAYAPYGWDTWFFSALDDETSSHPTSIDSTVQAYVDAGISRSKLGIGIGMYCLGYFGASAPRVPENGWSMGYWDDVAHSIRLMEDAGMFTGTGCTYHWDEAAGAGYYSYSPSRTYSGESGITMVTTEDNTTIAAKGSWAKAGGCGGVIIWTLNYGGTGSMAAVKSAFL